MMAFADPVPMHGKTCSERAGCGTKGFVSGTKKYRKTHIPHLPGEGC